MQFQKISIPTPWKVNGNSEGVGGLKSQNFKRKVWGSTGNSRGVGGIQTKKPSVGGVWIFSGTTQWLVGWTPDQAVRVRAPAGALRCVLRQDTLLS